jgi:DinB superfamily
VVGDEVAVELTPPASRAPSGRPDDDEFAAYAKPDIDLVVGDDAIAALTAQRRQTVLLVESLDEERVRGLTYSPGKWTLKEVLGHVADDERIYAYRALCIARGDAAPLPSFDEIRYVAAAGFETRSLVSLLGEYRAVRQATLALLGGLPAEAWRRRGVVSDYTTSVRGLAFHIAGHELRHIRSLREKYLR